MDSDLQNTTHKTNNWATRIQQITGDELCEGVSSFCCTIDTRVATAK
jgi:hypothetical protein